MAPQNVGCHVLYEFMMPQLLKLIHLESGKEICLPVHPSLQLSD